MQIPVMLDRSSGTTLTDQIVDQLRQAIEHARLPAGSRLPSSRRLSDQLDVARNTVIRAYETLMLEGLVDSRPASGLFVAASSPTGALPDPAPSRSDDESSWSMPLPPIARQMLPREPVARSRPTFDFVPERANHALFPLKLWRRLLLKRMSQSGAKGLTEGSDATGLPGLCSAIALHLATTRGIVADPSRIIVVSSVQEGVGFASRLFLRQGTVAAIEDPGSRAVLQAFQAAGAETVGVGIDEDGLVPDDLPRGRTALLYLTPSHQFPTGVTLLASRRDTVAAWARRSGCYILEDDSNAEIRFDGSNPPAIAAGAPDCTIYLGSFALTLGAGLGLAFMVVPPRLAPVVTAGRALLNPGGAWLEQAAVADMMTSSSYITHVSRVRAHYRENRDCLLAALRRSFGEVSVSGGAGGLNLLWHLPAGVPDAPILEILARRARIGVYALASAGAAMTRPTLLGRRALLLGFGGLVPNQIDKAIDRLSEVIDDAIDNPQSDVSAYLVGTPTFKPRVPRRAQRAPAQLDSRFKQPSVVPKLRRAPSSGTMSAREEAKRTTVEVSSIYRYPVKGLSAQPLRRAETEAGKPIAYDRVFALARPTAPVDRNDPKWAKKGLFAMLMLDEGLARVRTELDVETMRLTVRRGTRLVAAGRLTDEQDRAALEQFFWTLLPSCKAPPVLVRSRTGHFMDKPDNVISLINLATLRDLEQRWHVKLDPLRFRANIYIDGARPWEEFDWVGGTIHIGGAPFLVDRVNGRCGATNVDPATGRRDLEIPTALRATFGHKNLGIYLLARENGAIAVGDTVLVGDTGLAADAVAARPATPSTQAGKRKQFMCRGCYYIYDEGAGLFSRSLTSPDRDLPDRDLPNLGLRSRRPPGIPPGTSFEALPADWHCPDCGSDKSLFSLEPALPATPRSKRNV